MSNGELYTIVTNPERNAVIKFGNTDVTVELYFPDYSAVLVCDDQDDYYTKPLGESEIPSLICISGITQLGNNIIINYLKLHYILVI